MLDSRAFARSELNRKLLLYISTEMAYGRGNSINEYTIAQDIFGRGDDFDPAQDPIVRVRMGRLRAAIERFNSDQPVDAPRLDLPLGQYKLVLRAAPNASPSPRPGLGSLLPLLAAIILVAVGVTTLLQMWSQETPRDLPLLRVDAFRNHTGLAANDALEKGLQEQLILDLQRFGHFHVAMGDGLQADMALSGILLETAPETDVLIRITTSSGNVVLERRLRDQGANVASSMTEVSRRIAGLIGGPRGAIFAHSGGPVFACLKHIDGSLINGGSYHLGEAEKCSAAQEHAEDPMMRAALGRIELQRHLSANDLSPETLAPLAEKAEALVSEFPGRAHVQLFAAQTRLAQGDVPGAISALKNAVQINPADAAASRALSQALVAADQLEDAAYWAQQSIASSAAPRAKDHLPVLIWALAQKDAVQAQAASRLASSSAKVIGLIEAHLAGDIAQKSAILAELGQTSGPDPVEGLVAGPKAQEILREALREAGLP